VAGGPTAALGHIYGIAADRNGNVYVAATAKDRIYRFALSSPGNLSLIAGTGEKGFSGDGGDARLARFANPIALKADSNGDLYVVDQHNFRIRKITMKDGVVRTVAGDGNKGFAGDGGPPERAQFNAAHGIAFDRQGNLFIADESNNRVRMIRFGPRPIITTVAGDGTDGFGGDGGDPLQAQLSSPAGVAFDMDGNLLVSDMHNNRIRKVTLTGKPVITTVVGSGVASSDGDGGDPRGAGLSGPNGLSTDQFGTLYIADCENHRIRKVIFGARPRITTLAGTGLAGFSGDGGPAPSAKLSLATDSAVGTDGNLYIADYLNDRVRRVQLPQKQ
jgi:trimeric autotransporter adhesin